MMSKKRQKMSDKHFEKREEHYEVKDIGNHLDPTDNRVCSGTDKVR